MSTAGVSYPCMKPIKNTKWISLHTCDKRGGVHNFRDQYYGGRVICFVISDETKFVFMCDNKKQVPTWTEPHEER